MIRVALHKDLQLSKKSARWVTKRLYEEMKKETVSVHEAIVAMIAAASFRVSWG